LKTQHSSPTGNSHKKYKTLILRHYGQQNAPPPPKDDDDDYDDDVGIHCNSYSGLLLSGYLLKYNIIQ
jgi:hypothetical protein